MARAPPARLGERPLHSRSLSSNLSAGQVTADEDFNSFYNFHQEQRQNSYLGNAQRTASGRYVKWGIVWYAPMLMGLYIISGIALAIGHHFYFSSLNGTVAGSSQRQQWAVGFGTAISFLVVALLRSATSAAYNQFVWILVRRRSYQLGTIDKLFALTTDPTGFFGVEMLKAAKIAMVIALISWITPLAGIAPPASLSVVPGLTLDRRPTSMALLDWNSPAFYDLQPFYSLPSSKVVGIATQSALSRDIIPLTPPAPNSSFSLQFYGPSIQCSPANSTQQLIFDYYNLALVNSNSSFRTPQPIVTKKLLEEKFREETLFPTNSTLRPPDISQYSMLVLSAFAPYAGAQGWLNGLKEPGAVDQFNNWDAILPWEMDEMGWDVNRYLYDDVVQSLFVQTSTDRHVCIMGNASYNVAFEFINGAQATVNYSTSEFVPTVVMRSGGGGSSGAMQNKILPGPYNRTDHTGFELSYMAVWESFTSMISGNISFGYFGLTGDRRPGLEYNLTLRDISSRALLTGLSACDDIVYNSWDKVPLTLQDPNESPREFFQNALKSSSNVSNSFMAQPAWMCRNKTLPRAIEDLIGNITISMLSSSNLTASNFTTVNVTYQATANMYRYDNRNLLISYSVAILLTLLCVAVGVFSFLENGVAHSMSFSAVMATTRNQALDDVTLGCSMGVLPLDDDLKSVRLRFGELDGSGGPSRLGFGLEGSVGEIERFGKYQ